MNINTAYYDKGLIVYDRFKILKNYYKTNFLSDMMYLSNYFYDIYTVYIFIVNFFK
jgi:hypothetical protein